ncbi:hypothetical protein O3P69_001153 [Scylla paramamosain]|uniref:Uncharacterized protein n=1 Tax=Scylla paramamosain TaxID=85552 RepID=A0AAW0UQC7_SCYPA
MGGHGGAGCCDPRRGLEKAYNAKQSIPPHHYCAPTSLLRPPTSPLHPLFTSTPSGTTPRQAHPLTRARGCEVVVAVLDVTRLASSHFTSHNRKETSKGMV